MNIGIARSALAVALVAMSGGALAHEVVYYTTLSGAAEAPPNASAGTGWARVTVDFDTYTMRVEASFEGLTGDVTVAHIHCCTAVPGAGTVGVATPTPTFPGFPSGVTAGSYDTTFDMSLASSWNAPFITNNGGSPLSAFGALTNGLASGSAYLNVHSTFAPGGEIRGFLAPVPEPETYAMLMGGLALVGWAARRRAAAR